MRTHLSVSTVVRLISMWVLLSAVSALLLHIHKRDVFTTSNSDYPRGDARGRSPGAAETLTLGLTHPSEPFLASECHVVSDLPPSSPAAASKQGNRNKIDLFPPPSSHHHTATLMSTSRCCPLLRPCRSDFRAARSARLRGRAMPGLPVVVWCVCVPTQPSSSSACRVLGCLGADSISLQR